VLINYIIFKIDGGRSGTQKPFLNVNKILLDNGYVQEVFGWRSSLSKARKDILNLSKKGLI
jgi:hypothetical protein